LTIAEDSAEKAEATFNAKELAGDAEASNQQACTVGFYEARI